jgi:hypothetical protein
MVNSKHSFWLALIFTISIFIIGLSLGFLLENQRQDFVQIKLFNSEINLLDEQIRSNLFDNFDINCDIRLESTFNFADKIYWDARELENYEGSSNFVNDYKVIHKRYDLLRVLLWKESLNLKENCNSDFHTIIYFYDYDSQDLSLKSKQLVFSRVLLDLKEKYGGKILLIPIALNLEIESVQLLADKYTVSSSPSILIDESILIQDIPSIEELEKVIF